MSEGRRSSRSKKNVDYSTYGDGEDSDGDFAEPTPPISKKPAKAEKEKSKKTKKKTSKQEDENYEFKETTRGKRKARRSVDVFDRELELALELSRVESSQDSQDENTNKKMKAVEVLVHTVPESTDGSASETASSSPQTNKQTELKLDDEEEENDDKENLPGPLTSSPVPKSAAETTSNTLKRGRPSEDSIVDDFDVIETLDMSDVSDSGRGGKRSRRKAAAAAVAKQRDMVDDEGDDTDESQQGGRSKRRKKSEDDEDFDAGAAKFGDSEESGLTNDDSRGDEDFSVKTKKSKSKKKKKEKEKESKTESKKEAKKTQDKSTSKPKAPAKGKGQKTAVKTVETSKSPAPPLIRRGPVGRAGPMKGFTPPSSTPSTGPKSAKCLGSPHAGMVALKRPAVVSPAGSGNNPLGGVKLVSPGQPLRLGLSKFARVKPLHSNVKV